MFLFSVYASKTVLNYIYNVTSVIIIAKNLVSNA
jgi:hypothetical protein